MPFFDDFALDVVQQGEAEKVKLTWKQKGTDYPMQPYHLSDGSIRFICLATALLQPNPPSTIIIDEPELGLHPETIGILAELITIAAKQTQVIIATQSPQLLDNFGIDDIIIARRDKGATFKQALNSGSAKEKKDLIEEYGKSIITDYSYKYFYEDGYGKDYRIYNLKKGIAEETRQIYLIGCLVSFYQQMKVYLSCRADLIPYQVEKPLLVFVGNRVTTSTSVAELTDVEEVIGFLDTFLRDKAKSIERIRVLFHDDTGLVDGNGNELFQNIFSPLSEVWGTNTMPEPEAVYMDILKLVFNTQTTADEPRLHLVNLKQVSGEIALRVGSEGKYFGIISIGDTAKLTKLCEEKGIVARSDEFVSESFFRSINGKKSAINLLIGSRKFTAGWNSWRVSTMGLINFAKGEGSQAIQLFGRGVRLRGYNGCLKRSSKIDVPHKPPLLPVLETLTIFGIKAQYMEDFKKYLQDEGAPVNDKIFEFRLPTIKRYDELQGKKLQVLRVAPGKNFKKQSRRLILNVPDDGLMRYLTRSKIVIDCRAKVQTIESEGSFNLARTALVEEQHIKNEWLDFLDYQRIFEEIEQYKNEKFYYNISIDASRFKDILQTEGLYALLIPANHLEVDSMEKLFALTDYSILILQNYLDRFFKYHKEKWESPFLTYQELTQDDANFVDEYKVTYTSEYSGDPTADELETFLQGLKKMLDEKNGIPDYKKDFKQHLFAFDFRNHLYAPLICVKADGLQIQISPVALNFDEMRFVDYLKKYTEDHGAELEGKSFYLLRNKSKTGLGFFEADNFYPDYILWLDTPAKQYISFIDPKGLTRVPWDSPKIMFYQKIKERQKQMIPPAGKEIILNSFIMSGTSPAMLKSWWPQTSGKDDWLTRHVLCLDHADCAENMFKEIERIERHQRSAVPKKSRKTYLSSLVESVLTSNQRQTMSLEDLVTVWSILHEPNAIAEALPSDSEVQDWASKYPDAITEKDDLLHVLMDMINRHSICISKDLQVTLLDTSKPSEDAKMDAHLAMAAIHEIRRNAPVDTHIYLKAFSIFKEKYPQFIEAAQAGEYAYAA